LVAGLAVSASAAAYYSYQYGAASSRESHDRSELQHLLSKYGSALDAAVLLDFGNGTRQWRNSTSAQPGWNAYTLTLAVTNGRVNATYYPQYSEHFVTSIYGVSGTDSEYWTIYSLAVNGTWICSSVGVDQLPVENGSVFAWAYSGNYCGGP
jgi:Domain of unknown function (DUF4430)